MNTRVNLRTTAANIVDVYEQDGNASIHFSANEDYDTVLSISLTTEQLNALEAQIKFVRDCNEQFIELMEG